MINQPSPLAAILAKHASCRFTSDGVRVVVKHVCEASA